MKNPFTNLRERWYHRFVHKFFSKDLLLELQLRARDDSADYVQSKMAHAMICASQKELFEYCARFTRAQGLCLEFGVASGSSIRKLAAIIDDPIHGFDTFNGLPEDWSGTLEARGKFARPGTPKVPASVSLHAGLFDATLPPFLENHSDPARFIHIDCDLYSSTRTVLDLLRERLVNGTVIVFDEYFNYPNWQVHEYRAFQEAVTEQSLTYRYLAFTRRGGSVGVIIE